MSFNPQPRARVHFDDNIAHPQPLIPTPYISSVRHGCWGGLCRHPDYSQIPTIGRIDSLAAPTTTTRTPPPLAPEGEYFVPTTSSERRRHDNASTAEADALRRRVQQLEIEAHRARESAALAVQQLEFERECARAEAARLTRERDIANLRIVQLLQERATDVRTAFAAGQREGMREAGARPDYATTRGAGGYSADPRAAFVAPSAPWGHGSRAQAGGDQRPHAASTSVPHTAGLSAGEASRGSTTLLF
ncbi:hypothetical protein K488DRAFT_72025 [Vararia minispora EC-137]|uniref:Uncharacterized protein n=1 Tax=Vararia minispora EC-137 TaxID=1314806 RepID=A0ACB8QFM8_9AGAM|nr:hypothetical protein K488DRAFT_72025 [Vararia minispora EC-137]